MKTILVVADQDGKKQTALQRAIPLARTTKATLVVTSLVYDRALSTPGILKPAEQLNLQKAILNRREEELQEIITKLDTKGVKISLTSAWEKDIAHWVTDYCKTNPCDMVIKTGHRSESWIYTPTDWQLIRECSSPVMIVASKTWKKKPRILAALDLGSKVRSKQKLNEKICRYARELAEATNSELHCCYAIEVPQVLSDMDLINPREYVRKAKHAIEPQMNACMEAAGIDDQQCHIKQGKPAKVINSIANKLNADIVITGSVGRKGMKGKLVGNTAESTLTLLRTDIITLKP